MIIGVDLSGPSNVEDTAAVALEDDGAYRWHAAGLGDRELLERLAEEGRRAQLVVGLDAPLSYNPGGGDRPADWALRHAVQESGLAGGSVMPPTMTRMAYLTLRGMTVARMLADEWVVARDRICEVHPGAAMALRGADPEVVRAMKSSEEARHTLVDWLREAGLTDLPETIAASDHLIAAAAAALAAWRWHVGHPRFLAPSDPPHHPFPVVA